MLEEESQRSEVESKRHGPLGSSLSHTLKPGQRGSQEEETEKNIYLSKPL